MASAPRPADPCAEAEARLDRARSALADGRSGRSLALLGDAAPACPSLAPRWQAQRARTLADLARFSEAREALSALPHGSTLDEASAAEALLADLAPQRGSAAEAERLLGEARAAPDCARSRPLYLASWRASHPRPDALLGASRCSPDPVEARRLAHRAAGELEAGVRHALSLSLVAEDRASDRAAFSPDGRWLARSEGTIVSLSRTGSFHDELRLDVGPEQPTSLRLVDGGPLITAAAGDAHVISFWSTTTGERLARIESPSGPAYALERLAPGDILPVAVDAKVQPRPDDEPRVVTAVELWDVKKSARIARVLPTASSDEAHLVEAAQTRDGALLALLWSNDDLSVVRTRSGEVIGALRAHNPGAGSPTLWFSPDGKRLAYLRPGNEGALDQVLWGIDTRKDAAVLAGKGCGHDGALFSPSGRLVATGSSFFTLCFFDASTGRLRFRLPAKTPRQPFEDEGMQSPVAFVGGERGLLSAGLGDLGLWDLGRRAPVSLAQTFPRRVLFEQPGRLVLGSDQGAVTEIDAELRIKSVDLKTTLLAAEVDAAGSVLVGGDPPGVFDLRSGERLRDLEGGQSSFSGYLLEPSGRFVVEKGPVQIWELASGKLRLPPRAAPSAPRATAIDPRQGTLHALYGTYVASWNPLGTAPPQVVAVGGHPVAIHARDGRVSVVHAGDRPSIEQLGQGQAQARTICEGAVGADDEHAHAAVSEDGSVVAWSPKGEGPYFCPSGGGPPIGKLEGASDVERIAACPGGFVIGTRGERQIVVTASGRKQEGVPDEALSAVAVGKGGLVALATRYGEAHVALAQLGQASPPTRLAPLEGEVAAMVFSPEGGQLVRASYLGQVVAVSPVDGKVLWRSSTRGRVERLHHAGRWVAAQTRSGVELLSAADGRRLGEIEAGEGGSGVASGPGGAHGFGADPASLARCAVGLHAVPAEVCLDRLAPP